MTPDLLRRLALELNKEADRIEALPVGDGQGAFLSDMTEEEYEQHRHEIDHGWRPFMDRLRGTSNKDGDHGGNV